ncbi:TPA: GDP-L-fucose synthase [Trebouxia sp. C0006]
MPKVIVLVTGGTGLVGRAVQEVVMRESGHDDEIWVFAGSNDGDLTSRQAAATLFAKVQPTHVLHLAAKVGGLYANANDNVGFWRQNMAIQVPC